MKTWLLAFLILVVVALAPIVQRVSSWGDPICRHEQCPVGYEVWR